MPARRPPAACAVRPDEGRMPIFPFWGNLSLPPAGRARPAGAPASGSGCASSRRDLRGRLPRRRPAADPARHLGWPAAWQRYGGRTTPRRASTPPSIPPAPSPASGFSSTTRSRSPATACSGSAAGYGTRPAACSPAAAARSSTASRFLLARLEATESKGHQMPRPAPVVPEQAEPAVGRTLEALPPLNVFRMVAHAGTAFRPWLALGGALLGSLELDPRLRELAILRVAGIAGCDYERVQHEPIAIGVGASAGQVAALAAGRSRETISGPRRSSCSVSSARRSRAAAAAPCWCRGRSGALGARGGRATARHRALPRAGAASQRDRGGPRPARRHVGPRGGRRPTLDRADDEFESHGRRRDRRPSRGFQEVLAKVAVVVSDRGAEVHAYGQYFGDGVAREHYEDRIVIYRDTLERDFGHDRACSPPRSSGPCATSSPTISAGTSAGWGAWGSDRR